MESVDQSHSSRNTPPSGATRPTDTAFQAIPRRRRYADRVIRWLVVVGGFATVVGILGIGLFILREVGPLLESAEISTTSAFRLPEHASGALIVEDHQTQVAILGSDGHLRVFQSADGRLLLDQVLFPDEDGEDPEDAKGVLRGVSVAPGTRVFVAATGDGCVLLLPMAWQTTFDAAQKRVLAAERTKPRIVRLAPAGRTIQAFTGLLDPEGTAVAAAQLDDRTFVLVREEEQTNAFTGETTRSTQRGEVILPFTVSQLVVDTDMHYLYGGTTDGHLLWWDLRGWDVAKPQMAAAGKTAVTALSLLIGGRSLVVGQANGDLSVWQRVRVEGKHVQLIRVHDFPSHPGPIRLLAASMRRKGFLAQDDTGLFGIYYSTSERVLWREKSPLPSAVSLSYAPKEDGAFFSDGLQVAGIHIRCEHPEVSWKSLWGKVWYEGYSEPAYVWQSSSATDDFEPKLSLTPLMVGTLKGTFYSLILAIPLGILGAIYTSQFMHPTIQRYVKPTVEIMASLPSVVLGFLAGLWLAPRIEQILPGLLLAPLILPVLIVATGFCWHGLMRKRRIHAPDGADVLPFLLAILLGLWISLQLSQPLEALLFGGCFPDWLDARTGLRFEQRNAIVVGLAMGFAVIPIIFAISEDSLSNVPRHLVSASLALGASRWQTAIRVVLPTASPGIFSAVMVGLGRAVGETMIVVMATGNTPIIDWSPFNGFRTFSANIAVEVPEAPVGGTLYRTLFLSGLVLFIMTFIANTVAELVRQRLRRQYARL